MSIKFIKEENKLFIKYEPQSNSLDFIESIIDEKDVFRLRRTFYFRNFENINDSCAKFELAILEGDYWVIKKKTLDLKYDLRIDSSLKIDKKLFIALRDISIFKKLDKIIDEPIIIGGKHESAIPIESFNNFLDRFPTTTELDYYTSSRIERVLSEYFTTMLPAEEKLNKFLIRKSGRKQRSNALIEQDPIFVDLEIMKFERVYQEIEELLKQPEDTFLESEWQKKVIGLIKLIFPKYIAVFENVKIYDFYTEEDETKKRYIDLLLVDFNGNVDVLEIKRPFDNKILCSNPKSHRDNYVPHKELSTAIMQAEKYIFHLSKWGKNGEKDLTNRLKNYLPEGLSIKISNPKTIVLLGRSHAFDRRQILDFEIIKRQFSHVADIMSYDDLLNRVGNILNVLKKEHDKLTI